MIGMPTPPSEESKLLFRLLADREWHSFDQVRDAIAVTVSPGRAYRTYEADLDYRRKYRNDPTYDRPLSEASRVEIGQRMIAAAAIRGWKKSRALIQRMEGDVKQIRVRPGFAAYGIPGFDPEEQDPGSGAEGYTEVPLDDSEPSEVLVPTAIEAVDEQPVVEQDIAEPGDAEPVAGVPEVVVEAPEKSDDAASSYQRPVAEAAVPVRCDVCGLLMTDQALHAEWHKRWEQPNTPPNDALLDGSQLRDVVRDVVEQVLDGFQQGMQVYLDGQFAQLEAAIGVSRRRPESWIKGSEQQRKRG